MTAFGDFAYPSSAKRGRAESRNARPGWERPILILTRPRSGHLEGSATGAELAAHPSRRAFGPPQDDDCGEGA